MDDAQTRRWLWIIVTVAVLVRILAAFYLGDRVEALPGTQDQVSYDNLALRVVTGHGFTFATDWWPATRAGEPTAHWSFLYTLYLAGIYAIFGHHPLVARLIQAIATGLLMPWLVYRLGRRLFSLAVGLAAALIMALYAYFVYYAAALMTEGFYITAILWALDLAGEISASAHQRIVKWVLLGVALGVATLLRQIILLFVPFLLAWLWWAARSPQPATHNAHHASRFTFHASRLLCALLVLVAFVLPWTVRNYRAFGQFVLLNTNSGYAFFWANHPVHDTHFIDLLPPDGPSYQELIPPELRSLDEAALDRALLERGLRFVAEDPARYLLLSLSRIPDYFQFWPSPRSGVVSNLSRVLSFGIFLPFMLWGLILSLRQWRSCLPLYTFMTVYTLVHILSWTGPRYRLPIDAVLIVFAGLAVGELHWLLSVRLTWLPVLQGAMEDRHP
jgi:4-amino-4-deoxy-L-arabinose transferase-like glycosyltransferase